MRRGGVGVLVAVLALEAERVVPHAEVAVSVDESGVEGKPLSVDDLLAVYGRIVAHIADLREYSVLAADESAFAVVVCVL